MATKGKKANPLSLKYKKDAAAAQEPFVHVYCNGAVCETDNKGHANPGGRSPVEIVVDATEGFIPLWDRNLTLRWRFQERSMAIFRSPEDAKDYLRELFAKGILLWEDAPPIKFSEAQENWDFELVVKPEENCSPNGCVLASAFFPDAGQHELNIYPTMFEQSMKEQVETMAHEIGHIFGLRHFFADIEERRWKSEIFGKHSPFSIMNYGPKSRMTKADRSDLKKLYEMVWRNELSEINGTPIQIVRPHSAPPDRCSQFELAAMIAGYGRS